MLKGDVHNEAAVAASFTGAFGAVNAVSLYVERGADTFEAVHVEAATRVARLARETRVERLVHISGIGADPTFILELHPCTWPRRRSGPTRLS